MEKGGASRPFSLAQPLFPVADMAALDDTKGMAARGLRDRLRGWARTIVRDVGALWLATRDSRVPWHAKLLAGAVAAYALSPIDLIPDLVPVLGYVDDLIIVPLGIWAALKLIPEEVMDDLRAAASGRAMPKSKAGLAIVLALWLAAIGLAGWIAT